MKNILKILIIIIIFIFGMYFYLNSNSITKITNDIPQIILETTENTESNNVITTLITNEYAYWNSTHTDSIKNNFWDMTSGSLFLQNNKYWTGKIDAGKPNALSTNFTNSAIFRLNTKDFSYKNFSLSFNLEPVLMTSTPETPKMAWDGVHVFLRYQSEFNLYYASVLRRDGYMAIKKKCIGGDSNGGTYYDLTSPIKISTPININISIQDQSDDSVKIQILDGTKVLISGTDKGIGCSIIKNTGAVGIRGDNTEFYFDSFNVVKI